MRKLFENERGITLVALVITIIILLILAGISIATLTGSGLFENARKAEEKSREAQEKEQSILGDYENKIQGHLNGKVEEKLPENTTDTEAGTIVKLPSNWGTQNVNYIRTADGTEVTEVTKVSTVYAVSVGNGETVPVPNGFYYVGGTKNSGVVISDDSRDQNKYAGVADVPAGAVYNSDGTVKTYTDEEYENLTKEQKNVVLMGNQFVWIPCSISEYTKYDFGKTNASGWDTSTNTAEETQIQKYGGFYCR